MDKISLQSCGYLLAKAANAANAANAYIMYNITIAIIHRNLSFLYT
jgi:hypothetical protein